MNHHVTIGGTEIPIKLPELESVRMDLATELTATRNGHRVWAAVLGLCWAGPRAPKASYARARFDVLVYGGQVWDELVGERKLPAGDVIDAGVRCWRLINGLPLEAAEDEQATSLAEDIEAAGDFSEAGALST